MIGALPVEHVDEAVITVAGELFAGGAVELARRRRDVALRFHRGRLGGTWPQVNG